MYLYLEGYNQLFVEIIFAMLINNLLKNHIFYLPLYTFQFLCFYQQ